MSFGGRRSGISQWCMSSRSGANFKSPWRRCLLVSLVLFVFLGAGDAQRPFYAVGWGSNAGSRLGRGVANVAAPNLSPERLALGPIVQAGVLLNIKEILVSQVHGMAILTTDEMLVWGNNDVQQLGINSIAQFGQSTIVNPMFMRPSIPVAKLQLASNGNNSILLLAQPNAYLFGWGENVRGGVYDYATNPGLLPLPYNLTTPIVNSPTPIGDPHGNSALPGAADIKCSTRHCVTRTFDGHLFGWGLNGVNGSEVLPCPAQNASWCDFTSAVMALIGTNSAIIQTSLADMNTVLLTNKSDLVAHGYNIEISPPSGPPPPPPAYHVNLTLYPNALLPDPCQLTKGGHVDQIVGGHDFHLLRCGNSVFAFGVNDLFQLGNSSVQVANITQMQRVLLEGANSNETVIIDIAAGKASGYAVGQNGTLIAWGSTDSKALGYDFPANRSLPTILNLKNVTDVNCTITAISAHISSDGAFVVIGEKLGLGVCPPLPPGADFGYCNAKGYYTFQTVAVANGSVTMPSGMVMVGNMTMNGTATVRMPYGVVVQGRVDLGGTAQAKLSDKSEIVGDLNVGEQADVHIDAGSMSVVNGSLSLGANATLTLSNFTFTNGSIPDADNAVVVVDGGDVVVDGAIIIIVSEDVISALLAAGSNGTYTNITRSATVVESSSIQTTSGRNVSSAVTVTLASSSSSSDSCQTVSADSSISSTGLQVLLSLDSSSCQSSSPSTSPSSPDSPSNPASPTAKSRRTTYIIIGSVVGGVVVLAILVLIIVFAVPSAKQAVLPYHGTRV